MILRPFFFQMRVPHQQIDHLLSVALMGREGKTALKKGSAWIFTFELLFDSHQVMVLVWPELEIGVGINKTKKKWNLRTMDNGEEENFE